MRTCMPPKAFEAAEIVASQPEAGRMRGVRVRTFTTAHLAELFRQPRFTR